MLKRRPKVEKLGLKIKEAQGRENVCDINILTSSGFTDNDGERRHTTKTRPLQLEESETKYNIYPIEFDYLSTGC